MSWTVLLSGGLIAIVAGLDRTALLQIMLSRPLVAGSLLGWLLGVPESGLLIGALCELLWLSRMPVGAAIPPDDTQVAVGATCLTVLLNPAGGFAPEPVALFALLLAMPLGKVGQWFDRLARNCNSRLLRRAERAVADGHEEQIERLHLRGVLHFAGAALATFVVVVAGGMLIGMPLLPRAVHLLQPLTGELELLFPLVGAAVILATLHVSRALTLFSTSFVTVLLTIWLL
ncbi:PTS sugar transporter subunit IIC [Geothermobacter hydrogeniphilus]|uniref:PTS sugar transporter subunit IIC n=1 Tax=Geothermobacter hydrogeniphilus TaxID=1969733 RepID=UPI0015545DAE|nr:PTS sugar transporter subunit IIC [Geothermobacter hydrogeniphilus]